MHLQKAHFLELHPPPLSSQIFIVHLLFRVYALPKSLRFLQVALCFTGAGHFQEKSSLDAQIAGDFKSNLFAI